MPISGKIIDMDIRRSGSRPSKKGATENFTGSVNIETLFEAPEPARVHSLSVTFEAGARSAWHTHPLGQILIVTSGFGWTQIEGGPKEQIQTGDVIWCPPNTRHWHGATSASAMSHIAIQEALDGKMIDWMEKVSEEEYLAE